MTSKSLFTNFTKNEIKNKFAPGDKLQLKVYRQGSYKEITLILGEDVPIND